MATSAFRRQTPEVGAVCINVQVRICGLIFMWGFFIGVFEAELDEGSDSGAAGRDAV
jgi:hypothetical protein